MKTFKFIKVFSAIVVSTSMCAGTTLPVFALPETTVLTEDTNGSTYTLTYDENCDEDITVPKDQTCKSGDSIKVSKDKPKRDGYVFIGWSTDENYVYDEELSKDDEEFFEPSDKISLTEDTTLYAVWEIKEDPEIFIEDDLYMEDDVEEDPYQDVQPAVIYQLMFNSKGGTASFDHVDTDENGYAQIPLEEPVKDGNIFLGWAEDQNAAEPDYLPGDGLYLSNDKKLWAVWQEIVTYQLMFNSKGGTCSFDHVDTDEYGNAAIPLEEPVKDGNIFLGWAEDQNAAAPDYLPGDVLTLSNDKKLWAVWQEIVIYQLKFSANGGKMSFDHVDADENGYVQIPTEEPVKDGSTFLGWAENKDAQTPDYQAGEVLALAGDMKLYAVWQKDPVIYQLMFDSHGGTSSFDHVDTDEYGNAAIPMEEPVKEGNTFLGWAEDPESGKVKYMPGDMLTLTSDKKLYAVWKADPIIVQLKFDATGGSGGPEAINARKGDKVAIPAETPTKEGFKFLGWDSDPQAKKVKYTPGQEITADDMRLYAVWEETAVDVQIRFDATGGSGGPEVINAKKGNKVAIPAETPTKDGFKFLGWDSDPQAKTVKYTPGQEITAEDMRLYAIWEEVAIDVQIRFDATGGSGGPEVINAKKGDKVAIPAETPTKDGFKFLGWDSDPQAKTVKYAPGQEITADDMRLYAVWEKVPQKYNLLFDANGGTDAPKTVQSNEKGVVTIPDNKPKRDGFTFVGWGKTPASSAADYQPGQEITITSDTKLYAVWTKTEANVVAKLSFDANGGTGAPKPIDAASDGSVTIPTTGPYRNGYKFLGWSKDPKAKEASYKPGDKLNIYSDTTLYAVWKNSKDVPTGVNNNSTLYLIGAGAAAAGVIGLLLLKKRKKAE